MDIQKKEVTQKSLVANIMGRTSFHGQMLEMVSEEYRDLAKRLAEKPNSHNISEILMELGFRRVGTEIVFIQNNLVWPAEVKEIESFIHEAFKHVDSAYTDRYYSRQGSHLNKACIDQIKELETSFLKDNQNASYTFFLNGAVEVSAGSVELIAYGDLEACVRVSKVNKHEIELNEQTLKPASWKDGKVFKFIQNTCTDPSTCRLDVELMQSNLMGVAKLLHRYFNASDPSLVVLSELKGLGEEHAGGTGKGIYIQMLKAIGLQEHKIDGKGFRPDYEHRWGDLKPEHDVICIDDPKNTKDALESCFSATTDGIVINPKHKNQFSLSREETPKIVITTNDTALGTGESHQRRRYDIILYRYYNLHHQPIDDVGMLFGKDFPKAEYNKFCCMMFYYMQIYFQKGYSRTKIPQGVAAKILLREAKLQEIPERLLEFFDEKYSAKLSTGSEFLIYLKQDKNEYSKENSSLSSTEYNKKLRIYLECKERSIRRHKTTRDITVDCYIVEAISAVNLTHNECEHAPLIEEAWLNPVPMAIG